MYKDLNLNPPEKSGYLNFLSKNEKYNFNDINFDEIPFLARIISVADSYDAMKSERSYRDVMPQKIVRSEIEKNIGTQFDPDVAKCMLSIIDEDMDYELHE